VALVGLTNWLTVCMVTLVSQLDNYYSAERNQATNTWRGWMQYGGQGPITKTPDSYPTRREALAAIKAQHP
jgi:hypothetical protein